ncbi:MAG TPA: hypothetical protein VI233_17355 [Puia sp.]
MRNKLIGLCSALALLFSVPFFAFSQEQSSTPPKKKKKFIKEVYLSWGYNKEWYTHSNLHVSQPSLGNDYTMKGVKAHDHPGWDEGLFSKALSIPQYNYRLGFLLDEEHGWGFEINFDHTKYIIEDQTVRVKGRLNNHAVDTAVAFNEANGFYYYLNNGANFLLFNVTKRWHVFKTRDEKVKIDFLGKFGVGPVIPHVQNKLFGDENPKPGFQIGGWNTGFEGALRATFFHVVYLEYCNKLDYARYSGLKVYEGRARQAFGTYEMILNLGVVIPTSCWWKK